LPSFQVRSASIGAEGMPLVHGSTTDRFGVLRDLLEESLRSGDDVGASVCVISRGEIVADLWGGHVDAARTTPWERDTLVNVWSTTKTMTFLVALMLVDQGLLDFDAKVSRYWPEFAANGKDDIEVRHLMGHTSGLSGWSAALRDTDLADWDLCTSALAEQAPWWDDRTRSGYHALTQGYLIGELVRRVTGATIGAYLKSEVADVLGADFHIGLPEADERRVSPVITCPAVNFDSLAKDSIAYRTLTSPLLDPAMANERWYHAAEIPAANGQGNARSLATIQQIIANNGHAGGHRFFSERTGGRIFESQAHGIDQVLGINLNIGMGYGLASENVPIGPRSCLWMGFGGALIIMDQELELTVAYAMNKMRVGIVGDTRGFTYALSAVMAAIG
jgi:CubicO group peptidase (beta-lactamase class C family)